MKVTALLAFGTRVAPLYSEDVQKTINYILSYATTLLMEPGELADYAKGQHFLMNSKAKIIVLHGAESALIIEGVQAHIFFENPVVTQHTTYNPGQWTDRTVRRVSLPKSELIK